MFGGAVSNGSGASGVAVNGSGQAYVVGTTEASDFPTTVGAAQPGFAGPGNGFGGDAFVVKLNAAGTAFLYSTFVGGSGRDDGRGIAIDSSGNAYIAGLTKSRDFPVTSGAFQTVYRGADPDLSSSAFVTKLNASGSALSYSTYLGGSFFDFANGITVDKSTGNAYVTGDVQSKDFPVTSSALQKILHGVRDGFVTKLSASGSSLSYSTYLGGSGDEEAFGIAVNSSGRAYVVGTTSSSDFPLTRNAFQRVPRGSSPQSAFVTKISPTGSALTYSSLLGGSLEESAAAVGLDPAGNAYLTGFTTSSDFPTTLGAFDSTRGGFMDAFVVKVIEPSCNVPTTAPYIGICMPADGATVRSPVNIMAQTSDPTPVKLLQVYVDGVKKYEAHLSAIAVKLPMSAGKHRVTVQEYNTSNAHFAKTIFITVSP